MDNRADQRARLDRVDRSAWTSVKSFAATVGKWWLSVWVLTVLSGVVSFGLTVANVAQFPSGLWVGLLLAGLVLGPSVAFHSLRVERDSFKHLWEDKEVVIRILDDLEDLRAEAAKQQVDGRQLAKPDFDEWNANVDDWTTRTKKRLSDLHPAEAGNFTTLGVYDPKLSAGTKIFSDDHQTALLNLIRRIDILAEIRDRWTTAN